MALPLLLLPFAVPVALAAITGIALQVHNTLINPKIGSHPLIRELPQSGLTSYCIRPLFRSSDKVLNVFTRSGTKVYKFIRQSPSSSEIDAVRNMPIESKGMIYTLLDAHDSKPLATITIEGLYSSILFHQYDPSLSQLGLVNMRHAVEGNDTYRVFILPDGSTFQWTGKERFLERIITRPLPTDSEIRERIGVARRIGTRIWELKFDETQLPAQVVIASVLISILDQWKTVFGVCGWIFKPEENLQGSR
ncbi:uncharacterized protein V2V93DRAFT_361762 [Kockiozyma suomiensis]|uniref:uncharacterized protein n=1 Tax=Kockiozyma suomiensis TaxID=1337062 RepID=UPI003343E6B5